MRGTPRWAGTFKTTIGIVVCVFVILIAAATAVRALVDLPHTYAGLRAHGVPVTAHLIGCHTAQRVVSCKLSVAYGGATRTIDYPQNEFQFTHLAPGTPVAVLVDPTHPSTVYTVHDVDTQFNSGFGGLAIVAILVAVVALVVLARIVWRRRRSRRVAIDQGFPTAP